MTNKHKGFIELSSLIYLLLSAFILPSIYMCFLQLSQFSSTTLNSLLRESERLSIASFMYHDSLGARLELHSSELTFIKEFESINYSISNEHLKRHSKRTQFLSQFLKISSINKISDSCFFIKHTNSLPLELCISSI